MSTFYLTKEKLIVSEFITDETEYPPPQDAPVSLEERDEMRSWNLYNSVWMSL